MTNEGLVLYEGDTYIKINGEWTLHKEKVTPKTFGALNIESMSKLKVKAQSSMGGTKLLKIKTDINGVKTAFFYSVKK